MVFMDHGHSDPATDILAALNARGWNLYKDDNRLSVEYVIKNGPKTKLESNVHYVLLPAAGNPKSPDDVFDCLKKLAVKLNRRKPEIELRGNSYPMLGITLRHDGVKIHSPEGIEVPFSEFLNAIDSFVNFYDY